MSVMKTKYQKEIVPALVKKFNYPNVMMVPKLEKITVSMGVGEAVSNSKVMEYAVNDLTIITGQKPKITTAKKSIAGFKLREGVAIGCMVTLRGKMMYEFLNRYISIALPRVRDFRGVNRHSFDGRGNYSMGLKEQILFPEINYDKIDKIRGMNLNFTTTAKTDEECYELLASFGMPFSRDDD